MEGEVMKATILQGLQEAYQNLVHMVAEFLPRFVLMLIIVAIGLLVAALLRYVLRAILHLTKLDRFSEEAGAGRVLRKAALPSVTELLSQSLFWLVWLGFILLGISMLRIPELHEQISRLFQFLPQVLVSILILFAGLVAANFFSRATLLAAVNAGSRSPSVLSRFVRFVIWILAISMALEQIGLAKQTVVAAFTAIFGAAMLAVAIAFGLGGRHLARQLLERYIGADRKKPEHANEPSPL
jgi:small-conductance mechanosensitive channel